MELQANLLSFAANGIAVFAVSYDTVATLAAFAAAHAIAYPLLSDEGSALIERLGIRNATADPTSRAWGVPYPGTYFISADGRVEEKVFHDSHRTRDAAGTILYEHFGIELPAGGASARRDTESLTVVAALDADTFVRGERIGLHVTIHPRPGVHVYGRPLPDGYVPTTLTFSAPETVRVEPVRYPAPSPLRMAWLDEELMVYEDTVRIDTAVTFTDQTEDVTITAHLDVQACTTEECFVPRTLTFALPLTFRGFPS